MKPVMAAAATTAANDEQLVRTARAGSDEALEALYRRYRERIAAYVRGFVSDHGRAEDLVQEIFLSAFRSLRATDRTIHFKPWVYQIARNACIDHIRRTKRAEEVSIDSEDFKPSEEGRLSQATPTTDVAFSQRQDMEALRQAFGGLPRSQHEVLVMRELEGLSYAEIGTRMSLSPGAVESMLFRARRGLKDEYREIATGERCRRMQRVIAGLAEGVGGSRDRRLLARHVQDCASCRHEAIAMGLGALLLTDQRGRVRDALHRAAALLPVPAFLRRRRGGPGESSTASGLASRAQGALSNVPLAGGAAADHGAGLFSSAAAVVASVAVIAGGAIAGSSSSAKAPPAPTKAGSSAAGSGGGATGLGSVFGGFGGLSGGSGGGAGGGSSVPGSPPIGGGGAAGGGFGGFGGADVFGSVPLPGGGPAALAVPNAGSVGSTGPGAVNLPSVNGPALPNLGGTLPSIGGSGGGGSGSSGAGRGGSLPSISAPSLPTVPSVTAPSTRVPRLPSTPSVPTAPVRVSPPTVPSTGSSSSPTLPSTGSVTGSTPGTVQGTLQGTQGALDDTVQGTTGTVPGVTSGLGL